MDEKTFTIKNIRSLTKMNRAEFARFYEIPIRTLEDWESGRSKPPKYVEKLLILAVSNMEKGKDIENI